MIHNRVASQSTIDSVRKAHAGKKIALKELAGNWYTVKEPQYKICFITDGVLGVHLEGIQDGVDHYRFSIKQDSIDVNGIAANWPPYDCILNKINADTLEIKFYQYFSDKTHDVVFRRD
ncbi:MAG: hypothetical protein QM791_07915 [Ferruginibacter sp.]